MSKVLLIISRDYLIRVRRKAFWVLTLFMPVGLVLLGAMPALIDRANHKTWQIAVVDPSGMFQGRLRDTGNLHFIPAPAGLDLANLKASYAKLGDDGVLSIPADFNTDAAASVDYYSVSPLGIATESDLSRQLTEVAREIRLQQAQLTEALMARLNASVTINTNLLGQTRAGGKPGGEHQANSLVATVAAGAGGGILYIVLIVYGTLVMRGVAEEKTSRIAEVMISTVTPFQLMMGKIIGIALVGLTQFLVWLVIYGGLTVAGGVLAPLTTGAAPTVALAHSGLAAAAGGAAPANRVVQQAAGIFQQVRQLPLGLMAFAFLYYFLTGYLLYAALFAAIGSAMGDEPGDQALSIVVTLPIILSAMIMLNVLDQPHSTLAVAASIFPLSAPVVMLARIPFGVPVWQLLASMVCMVLGFLGATWLSAKIYRVGILMYGKKASPKELWRWLRY